MNNNLLLSELHLLQKRYRTVLVNAKDKINKTTITAVINEILAFWYQNRKLVECALKYLSKPFDSYLFRACLKSFQQHRQERQFSQAQGIFQITFAVFPKYSAFI